MSSREIVFRGMPASPAVEAMVRRWIARLDRAYDRIIRCGVVIELPHRHGRHGQPFHVRIELAVPDHIIVVAQESEDIYALVGDAFHAARRQLHEHAAIRRGDVKRHDVVW
jgi:ribosome-associated translation inhibitor RaiA